MKVNIGKVDRILRIVAGVILLSLAATGIFSPWGWVGIILLATGIAKYCPAYALLGKSSCTMENE